jgi:hypothetical protein
MAIHIHIHKTRDAGPAHAPAGSSKGGQFVSSGGAAPGNAAKLHHQKQAAKYRALHEKTGNPDHKAAAAAHGEAGFRHQNYSQASEHGSYWMESEEKQKAHLAKATAASNEAHAASLKAPLPAANKKPGSTPYEKKQKKASNKIDTLTSKTHPHAIGSEVTMHMPAGKIHGKVTTHTTSNGHPAYMVESDMGRHHVDVSKVTAKEK